MASAADGSRQPAPALDVRLLVDNMPMLAWSSHADGSLDFVNQQWRDYTGLSTEESHGPGWEAAVHPDDIPPDCCNNGRRSPNLITRVSMRCGCAVQTACFAGFRFVVSRCTTRPAPCSDGMERQPTLRIENRPTRCALPRSAHFEMIADGASLKDVLDQLCTSIDVQIAPSVTTVLLIDADGKRLWQVGGPRVPREWISTIIPVSIAFEAGLCGTAAFF